MKKEKKEDKSAETIKLVLAIFFGLMLIGASWAYVEMSQEENGGEEYDKQEVGEVDDSLLEEFNLVACLSENDVVFFGLDTCPACVSLVESLGGKEVVEEIYVECAADRERCDEEKETGFVPEIQIAGELYEGRLSPSAIADEVGCN